MKYILLIDDDPTIQKVFSQFLRSQNYEVEIAGNGKVGMSMMAEKQPDLIITDILMPEMDGLEILLEIREAGGAAPVIAISGGMRALPINFLKQAKLFGARHAFEKPVPLKVLLSAVKESLEEPPAVESSQT